MIKSATCNFYQLDNDKHVYMCTMEGESVIGTTSILFIVFRFFGLVELCGLHLQNFQQCVWHIRCEMMEYSFVGGWHQCVSVWSKLHVALYMLFVASLLSWQTVYVMYICFQTALRCYPIFVLITFNTYKYVRGKTFPSNFGLHLGKSNIAKCSLSF